MITYLQNAPQERTRDGEVVLTIPLDGRDEVEATLRALFAKGVYNGVVELNSGEEVSADSPSRLYMSIDDANNLGIRASRQPYTVVTQPRGEAIAPSCNMVKGG